VRLRPLALLALAATLIAGCTPAAVPTPTMAPERTLTATPPATITPQAPQSTATPRPPTATPPVSLTATAVSVSTALPASPTPAVPAATPGTGAPLSTEQAAAFVPKGAEAVQVFGGDLRGLGAKDAVVTYRVPAQDSTVVQAKALLSVTGAYTAVQLLGDPGLADPENLGQTLASVQIRDLLGGGAPAIIVTCQGAGQSGAFNIFRWDGRSFGLLFAVDSDGVGSLQINDLDGDKQAELTVTFAAPGTDPAEGLRWAESYDWDGNNYVPRLFPQLYADFPARALAALKDPPPEIWTVRLYIARAYTYQGKTAEAKEQYRLALSDAVKAMPVVDTPTAPGDTVQQYLDTLEFQDLTGAYRLLSKKYQSSHVFDVWASDLAYNWEVVTDSVGEASHSPTTAVVHAAYAVVDVTAQGLKEKRYTATWQLVKESGEWRLDSVTVREAP
jgi:hypothetical protein